jgi:excisionase family DNA binding protein
VTEVKLTGEEVAELAAKQSELRPARLQVMNQDALLRLEDEEFDDLLKRKESKSRLLTPSEVARLFRVDPKTVTRWAANGRLNSIKTPGGQRRFRESEVNDLLERLA